MTVTSTWRSGISAGTAAPGHTRISTTPWKIPACLDDLFHHRSQRGDLCGRLADERRGLFPAAG